MLDRFDDLVATRSDPPPRILYKYTSADIARKILRSGSMRFSSPLSFNDPFDSQWDVMWCLRCAEARQLERDMLRTAMQDPASWPADGDPNHLSALRREVDRVERLPPGERMSAIESFVADIVDDRDRPWESWFDNQVADQRRRLRVLCVAERADSLLMWSHYADQHRGVVFALDTQVMEQELHVPAERAIYSEGIPSLFDVKAWLRHVVFGAGELPSPEGHERAWSLTKSYHWKYECEWRYHYLTPKGTSGTHTDREIPVGALRGIVFGCKTTPRNIQRLRAVASSQFEGVQFSVARRETERFGVEIVEMPVTA